MKSKISSQVLFGCKQVRILFSNKIKIKFKKKRDFPNNCKLLDNIYTYVFKDPSCFLFLLKWKCLSLCKTLTLHIQVYVCLLFSFWIQHRMHDSGLELSLPDWWVLACARKRHFAIILVFSNRWKFPVERTQTMICWLEQKHSSVFIFESIEVILWCQKVGEEQLGQIFQQIAWKLYACNCISTSTVRSGEINAKGLKNIGNKWKSQGTASS